LNKALHSKHRTCHVSERSLQDLVGNVIPNTIEKIFPSGDPNMTDYAAARRIPYLVAFSQLALPFMFQWVSALRHSICQMWATLIVLSLTTLLVAPGVKSH
jgi:hypothetical protein